MDVLPLPGLRWKKLVSLFATLLFGVLGKIIKFLKGDQLETNYFYVFQNADLFFSSLHKNFSQRSPHL